MKAEFTHDFIKIFKKRFRNKSNFQKKFGERVKLFVQSPQEQILQDHPLSGKQEGYRAFSITGDIRVIYYIQDDIAYFVDVGTHNQVYGR